jgi:hypothetical protein
MRIYYSISGFPFAIKLALKLRMPNLLFSYAHAKCFTKALAQMEAEQIDVERVLLDSGAFTVWKTGEEIDVEAYCDFIDMTESLRISEFLPVALDVIPGRMGQTGTLTRDEIEAAARRSHENFMRMLARGIVALPVYHQGEDLKWLDKMLLETDYVGISPANDVSYEQRVVWLDEVFKHLSANYERVRTHGFGVMAIGIMKRYPWTSVDSAVCTISGGKAAKIFLPRATSKTVTGSDFRLLDKYNFDDPIALDCGDTRLDGKRRRHNLELENAGAIEGLVHTAPSIKLRPDSHLRALTAAMRAYVEEYLVYLSDTYKTRLTFDDLSAQAGRVTANFFFFDQFARRHRYVESAVEEGAFF